MYSSDESQEVTRGFMGRKVFTIEEKPVTNKGKLVSILKLAVLAFPWIGIQSIWQAEFSSTTPYLQQLGLSAFWSSNIWISGPIAGFLVAPVIGSLSDATTSVLGRRRPWMLGGLLFLGFVSMMLASSNKIFPGEENKPKALAVAATFFCLMDGSINIIQTPTRAFIADMAPPSKQLTGQLLASMFQGLGALLGFGLHKHLYKDSSDVFWLFTTVFLVNVAVFVPVCAYVTETPLKKLEEKVSICKPFTNVFTNIGKMSLSLLKIGLVQVFSWIALFSYWPIASTWMAISVKGGCPDANAPGCSPERKALYEEGLQLYASCGIYTSAFQVVLSFILSYVMYFGIIKKARYVYALGLLIGGIMNILGKFGPQTETMGVAIAIMLAIPVSVINSFPFAIVGRYNSEQGGLDTGTQFGILNLFIVVPQLAITFVVSAIRSSAGDTTGIPWILFMSGCSFCVAAVLALCIDETSKDKKVNDDDVKLDEEAPATLL
mmetsp:Transcript_4717/g.7100  ORF Transcript_4717/g.7100 Transcript_4717/m.7100 type:complete len:491 (+) Transcript_4717:46-1518(+)|eukprot:CAMPEP_0203763866 /NCGR_PEP_ID=MMETSP0098-20131031/16990_1 /ASSEMBLY_ACC=CAM_ASM_000208 /TAXON_ID=96639 /ORGANISM=" , Strain NY0313808BC1" /LENGTH=490 /DNA_ID=CAMNT_0050659175 /DNA_START=36 /DNA_END=1508 /DNA_ORIENTATION=+